MARTFNGSSANWVGAIGGCNLTPPWTILGICSHLADGRYDTLLSINTADSAGNARITLGIDGSSDQLELDVDGNSNYSTITLKTAEGYALIGVSKATGVVAPRFHKYVYGTNVWSHVASGSTIGNNTAPGASGVVLFGKIYASAQFFGGDILLGALFNRVLTDAEMESLPFSFATLQASAPVGLWLWDQSLTSQKVLDWTGNGANETTLTGTTIASVSVPVFGYGHSVLYPTREAAAAAGGQPTMRRWGGVPHLGGARPRGRSW